MITLDVHGDLGPSRSSFFSRGTGLAYGEVYHRAVSGKSNGQAHVACARLARLEVRIKGTCCGES